MQLTTTPSWGGPMHLTPAESNERKRMVLNQQQQYMSKNPRSQVPFVPHYDQK